MHLSEGGERECKRSELNLLADGKDEKNWRRGTQQWGLCIYYLLQETVLQPSYINLLSGGLTNVWRKQGLGCHMTFFFL